jgi:hypothetical protein
MKALNTFDIHLKSKFWSNKNKIYPNKVGLYSTRKFWFDCDKCNHDFEKTIQTITKMNTWCPYCSNSKLCIKENCNLCKEKSFIMNPKSEYWSNKNKITPRQVFKNSGKKYFFNCNKCKNEFEASLDKVSIGRWCRNCRDINNSIKFRKTLEEFINKANNIHNNIYDYSKVNYIKNSSNIIIICKIHGEFIQSPHNHLVGNGCPKCKNISYSNISISWLNFMSLYYNLDIQHKLNKGEFKIINTKFSVDGFSKENNCIWEFYGDYWHGNPKKYDLTKINPHINKTYKELHNKTLERKNIIINLGYNYKDIWESDWLNAIKLIKKIQINWKKKYLKEV